MATEKPRFSITVTDEIYKALEDYRHEAGLSSRSQAALAMIRKGFELVGKEQGIDFVPVPPELIAPYTNDEKHA